MTNVRNSLLLLLTLATWPWVGAATYYVDGNHPKAADTNAGTLAAPLKHIQAAADQVKPGDTIRVKTGVYREFIHWKTPGVEGKGISLEAAAGETVVVKGSVVVKGWERTAVKEAGLTGEYPSENLWLKRGWVKESIYPPDEPNRKGRLKRVDWSVALRSPLRGRLARDRAHQVSDEHARLGLGFRGRPVPT